MFRRQYTTCKKEPDPLSNEQSFNLALLLLIAFMGNVPLGYLREAVVKFSLRWFVYVHLSIPVIILLRHHYGFGWSLVPFTLGFAVIGQLVGGRLRRRATR
jgi:hypothetical protein